MEQTRKEMFAPSRGRELKYDTNGGLQTMERFAPSRGRELKFVALLDRIGGQAVRPLAGAGIEISIP